MGKPTKRSRDNDDDDERDEDEDRPKKKSVKQPKGGGNTMMIVLGLAGVAVVGLLCVCGGGTGAGFYFGWFGGGDKKVVAKGGDKDNDKDKDKDKGDSGLPRGTGPLVTAQNFNTAARDGKSLAQIEKILGPGLLLKGADADKAAKYQSYKFLRGFNANGDIYQWSNSQEIYFISFFDGGVFQGKGSEALKKK